MLQFEPANRMSAAEVVNKLSKLKRRQGRRAEPKIVEAKVVAKLEDLNASRKQESSNSA